MACMTNLFKLDGEAGVGFWVVQIFDVGIRANEEVAKGPELAVCLDQTGRGGLDGRRGGAVLCTT